jgi:hypothetical protein
MPYMILIPAHGLDKFISHLGVCHYITKTHLGGQDTLHSVIKFDYLSTELLSFSLNGSTGEYDYS